MVEEDSAVRQRSQELEQEVERLQRIASEQVCVHATGVLCVGGLFGCFHSLFH